MKSFHRIKLDIFKVGYRSCRPYQEKIDDFYEDGRIRFQWDMIKQAYMLGQEATLPAVCGECPINIFYQAEGCIGDIEGLNVFLRVFTRFKPDAEILKYTFIDDVLDVDATRHLMTDLADFEKFIEKLKWPVAQVFFKNIPVYYTHADGSLRTIFYEWEGEEDDNYSQGTEGYFWGRSQEGIVVKDSFGNRTPLIFKKLYKMGFGVYGESVEGKNHVFTPIMGQFPSWDDTEPRRESELVATEMPADVVFKDIMDMLTLFATEALKNNTGIQITSMT
jgi:hypothetical protein